MFVIARPGDEIAVAFNRDSLPALAPGQARTFLLFADGFSKEMDINSASPDRVEPLPFHGMSAYPYGAGERYPDGIQIHDESTFTGMPQIVPMRHDRPNIPLCPSRSPLRAYPARGRMNVARYQQVR